MTDQIADTIHATAQQLIVQGFLPAPYQIDVFDSRPLWDIHGLAALLDRRPDELIELLRENGPVFSPSDRGIPSSWRMLVEL